MSIVILTLAGIDADQCIWINLWSVRTAERNDPECLLSGEYGLFYF